MSRTVRKSPSQRRLWNGANSRLRAFASRASERLVGGERHGLVDDHVAARFEHLAREREVRVVRRGDHHALDVVEAEQRVEIGDDARARIRRLRAIGLTRRDRGDFSAAARGDHGRVERRAGETETHQTNPEQ